MVPIEALHAVASIQIRYQKVKLNQAKQTESPQHLRSGCFSRLSSKKSYFLVVINKRAEKKDVYGARAAEIKDSECSLGRG